MRRRGRIVSTVHLGRDPRLGLVVIASSDASEESKGGASVAVAIVPGLHIRSQCQRLREERAGAASPPA
jgi:hypothetical protein